MCAPGLKVCKLIHGTNRASSRAGRGASYISKRTVLSELRASSGERLSLWAGPECNSCVCTAPYSVMNGVFLLTHLTTALPQRVLFSLGAGHIRVDIYTCVVLCLSVPDNG